MRSLFCCTALLSSVLGFVFYPPESSAESSAESSVQKTSSGCFSVETKRERALRLSDFNSEIKIDGAFAETVLDLGYANSGSEALQGLFKIQLPQGAVIRDFALRLGDKWQYGTLTEKHKARTTFEEIVRGGADPAVLAWGNGAEYQVRIFPFPGKGKRYIRVRYWQELSEINEKFSYQLPLPVGVKVDHFRLKLDIQSKSLAGIEIGEAFRHLTYLKAGTKEKNSLGAIIDEKNFTITGELRLTASQTPGQNSSMWVGRAATTLGDLNYVAARAFVDLPEQPRIFGKSLLVFLDTSRSARPDRPAEVDQVLNSLLALVPTNTKVSFFEFNINVRKVERLDLKRVDYDGAADFHALFREVEKIGKGEKGESDVLILTDAILSMQREDEFNDLKINGAKVFFLPVKQKINSHFAATLASRSGGQVLPVAETKNITAIRRAFSSIPWQMEELRLDSGTVTDVYPEAGSLIDLQTGPAVYFRSKTRRLPNSVSIVVSSGTRRREFKVNVGEAPLMPEVEHLWAMKKLASLVLEGGEYEKDLMAHALRYQFVSPFTSYIVLENNWDYQRFDINQRAENRSSTQEGMMAASRSIPFGAAGNAVSVDLLMQEEASDITGKKMFAAPLFDSLQSLVVESAPVEYPDLMSAVGVGRVINHFIKGRTPLTILEKMYKQQNQGEMKDAWFFIEFAKAFAVTGARERALLVLSNLFEVSEEDGKTLRALGLVGCFEGNCEWAIQAFKLVIQLRPEEPQNYRDLAWLYAELGRLQEARETMTMVMKQAVHSRFPGMAQILEREHTMLVSLEKVNGQEDLDTRTYSWITWNNDNSDVDFYIREAKDKVVWYGHRQIGGELSNDFTRGYGPEIYMARKSIQPTFFVHYCRPDPTSAEQALVVKFVTVERLKDGKATVRSRVFPLYRNSEYVEVETLRQHRPALRLWDKIFNKAVG